MKITLSRKNLTCQTLEINNKKHKKKKKNTFKPRPHLLRRHTLNISHFPHIRNTLSRFVWHEVTCFYKAPIHRVRLFLRFVLYVDYPLKWPFRADWARQIFSSFSLLQFFFPFLIFIFFTPLFDCAYPQLVFSDGGRCLKETVVTFRWDCLVCGNFNSAKETRWRVFAIFAYCLYVILTTGTEFFFKVNFCIYL